MSAATARVNAVSHAPAASTVLAVSLFARIASARYSVNAASTSPPTPTISVRTARSIALALMTTTHHHRRLLASVFVATLARRARGRHGHVRSIALSDAISTADTVVVDATRKADVMPTSKACRYCAPTTRGMSVIPPHELEKRSTPSCMRRRAEIVRDFRAVRERYYDGCAFHRCVGIHDQSGDPTAGEGGRRFTRHFDEVSATYVCRARVLKMANRIEHNGSSFSWSFPPPPGEKDDIRRVIDDGTLIR